LARAEEAANSRAASQLHPLHSPAWFAEFNLLALQDIALLGLWECYPGMGLEWQADFWADLPWTNPARDQAIELMLIDPRYPAIRTALLAEFGLDLTEELRAGLGGLEDPLAFCPRCGSRAAIVPHSGVCASCTDAAYDRYCPR
jgi:hypothetical protein